MPHASEPQFAASTMMERSLLLSHVVDYGASAFGWQEVVSVGSDGALERLDFDAFRTRCLRAATALGALGVVPGERVATLAWTNRRHLELYFAIPGIGAVIHTINPRYSDAQISFILNHAGNRVVLVEPDIAERLRVIAKDCPALESICVLDDDWDAEVDAAAPLAAWPQIPETAGSSLCYTSGTTGDPKGVVYSHRSTLLYSLSGLATGKMRLDASATALMCVPMYHVNGWSKPYQAMLAGAKIVLPGPRMDGSSLVRLIDAERVTCGFGVPTIWLGLVEELRRTGRGAGSLRQISFGGGAVPRSLLGTLRDDFGVSVETGYGMTETTAGLCLGSDGPDYRAADAEGQLDLLARQRPIFGIDLRLAPQDGTSGGAGELQVRGHFVTDGYFRNPDASAATMTEDGWFRTGDVVSRDTMGRVRVEDRLKDLVKSGGEWISSVSLEQAACAHPDVAEAAVIGLPHPKWAERPLLIVRLAADAVLSDQTLAAFLAEQVPSWWCPDATIALPDLPRTATGKTDKKALRVRFAGWHYDHDGVLQKAGPGAANDVT
jgi:acyl-CoA synthetase (AMP-forming)/AMP-acid ligase II